MIKMNFGKTGEQKNGLRHLVALDGGFLNFVILMAELFIQM